MATRLGVIADAHANLPALDAALDALLATDFALKETRLSSDEQLLTNLVLTLCAPNHSRGGSSAGGRRPVTVEHG